MEIFVGGGAVNAAVGEPGHVVKFKEFPLARGFVETPVGGEEAMAFDAEAGVEFGGFFNEFGGEFPDIQSAGLAAEMLVRFQCTGFGDAEAAADGLAVEKPDADVVIAFGELAVGSATRGVDEFLGDEGEIKVIFVVREPSNEDFLAAVRVELLKCDVAVGMTEAKDLKFGFMPDGVAL